MLLDAFLTEILRKIMYEDEWSLTNVSLVCRRFRDITEPISFEEFRGEKLSAPGRMHQVLQQPYSSTGIAVR